MNSNKLAVVALLSTVKSQTLNYNYALHGSDWDLDYPGCGDSNQSPINLITIDRTASEFEYRVYDQSEDALQKKYWNQVNEEVVWTGDTTKVTLNTNNGRSAFQSNLGSTVFKGDSYYEAQNFVFHKGSEHTINGDRMDLEMQSIHS